MKKKYFQSLLVMAFVMVSGANAYALPVGAEFSVDESNDPLVLSFTGLSGSLTFDYFLETDWSSPGSIAWDVAIFKDTLLGPELDRIYITADSLDWTSRTITNAALTGSANLVVYVDDYGAGEINYPDNPVAYFRDFSADPTYVSGGQEYAPVPEPAAILIFGVGLASLAGAVRRRRR